MTLARVITPTSTFYPPDSQPQDDQTIKGILKFINSHMNSNLQYFRTNNHTIVFASWNNILFVISSVDESVAYLRFRLQMIREIAVFLFGPDFDQIMRNNTINVNFIDLFAKYVDTFLQMTENDYESQLGIISHDAFFSDFSNYLSENVPASQFPHDIPFIDCIIFHKHKIVSRFNLSNPINYLSIFVLAIFARIEYPEIDTNSQKGENDNGPNLLSKSEEKEKNRKYFDPNYVNITEPPSVQLRECYITVGLDAPQACSISSTLLGPKSPYVALFITQELNASVKRFIVSGIISLLSSGMSEAVRLFLNPLSFTSPGLVYFLSANRATGESFSFKTSNDEKSDHITQLLFRTMKNYTFEALFNGQTTFIWRDTNFLFTYMIFFIQNDGKAVTPSEKVKIPIFKENFNLSYQSICNEFFHKDKNIRVYEVYSIFLDVVPPQVAHCETIDMFIDTIKEKKISFFGSIDNLKASLIPHSKKNRLSLSSA